MASALSGLCRGMASSLLQLILWPENLPKLVMIQTVIKAEVPARSYILIYHQHKMPI